MAQSPENLQDADLGDLAAEEEAEQEAQVAQEAQEAQVPQVPQVPQQKVWKMRKPIERELVHTRAQLRALGIVLNKRSFKGDEILVAGAPIEALDKNTLLWVERWSQIGGGKRRYSQEWL